MHWNSSASSSSPSSGSSSVSSLDEDEVNRRLKPRWSSYRRHFERRGFRLRTVRDMLNDDSCNARWWTHIHHPGHRCQDDILPDPALPENLFRGLRKRDGLRVMFKAVHIHSREYNVISRLSEPSLRDDSMNHTIPVLDFILVDEDNLVFIVMEEWCQLVSNLPFSRDSLLSALRQCVEHVAFMHKHHLTHLDISLWNILTNLKGTYAYIDFEMSNFFYPTTTSSSSSSIRNYRATEVPPECAQDEFVNPFKIDIWALGIMILRICKLTGYDIPELMYVVQPMLQEAPSKRPSAECVLQALDMVLSWICYSGHHHMIRRTLMPI